MEMGPRRLVAFVASISVCLICFAATLRGGGFGGVNRAVGGIMIDANGIVRTATVVEKRDLANLMRVAIDAPQGDLDAQSDMRMVSLKGLQAAIASSRQSGGPLPESVAFLAGLQRIEYVFVDNDNNDIVIAGPAEPWQLQEDGSVVGTKSGGSVLLLEDLIVALRAIASPERQAISCSIEPTADGRRRLRDLLKKIQRRPVSNPAIYEESMKQAFGPQMIHLTGVPLDSHFARTLVAADYEMKRVAMALVKSPVKDLTSYIQMSRNSSHAASQNPRWWMACNYDALARSEDGTAWKLSGQGVKTLTEQDVVADDGSVTESGRQDKLAKKWADQMTEVYEDLSKEMPVFRDLRNAMDLAVVATLILSERLDQKAGMNLSELIGEDAVDLVSYTPPKAVQPQCSFVRGRSGWVVTASGGVDINPLAVVQNQETDGKLADARTSALAASSDRWWWDSK